MTVKVARMVGPPTSSTAVGMRSRSFLELRAMWRWMFSTTTMASSTRIPIEKIRAKRDTRLRVKPQAQEAKRVRARVTMMAAPTMMDSRQPMTRMTRMMTDRVAKLSFWISFWALASAVAP